jgi:hypothetical protein
MKTMTITMPDQMYVDLHRLARRQGISRGEDEARRTIASAYRSSIVEQPHIPKHIAWRLKWNS